MAKYTMTRKISETETIKIEQTHSWDECFRELEKGEKEIAAKHEERARLAEEEAAKELPSEPLPPLGSQPVTDGVPNDGGDQSSGTSVTGPPPANGLRQPLGPSQG